MKVGLLRNFKEDKNMDFLTVEKLLGDDCYHEVIINVDQITRIDKSSNLIFLSDGQNFNISDHSMKELLRFIYFIRNIKGINCLYAESED